jgi:RNA polymerase sigma-70 factor (ECF subfamily)
MTECDEHTLIEKALQGDANAFGSIVDAHQAVVFNLALRMLGDRDDASDVSQAVFLKVWEKLATFDRRNKLFSWIYRIALNETLNFRRRRRPHETLEDSLPAPGDDPSGQYEASRESRAVQEALMELKTADREIVILHHVLRYSHRDIGELHHVPEKTIKSRLFTARERLEACLRRRGFGQP